MIRSILALGFLVWCSALASCASSRPDDIPVPPPILAKTVWDDASGRNAPSDSLGRELTKMLTRRDDMVVFAADSEPSPQRRHGDAAGPGEGRHRGGHHGGGGGMPGEGEYGAGVPDRPRGEEAPRARSLRLLVAGTVERWDRDSQALALDASVGALPHADSLRHGGLRLTVRLVSKATGRVVWKTAEDCSAPSPVTVSLSDSAVSAPSGWNSNFDRCAQEVLRTSSRDVAAAALDIARKEAIREATERSDP